MKLLIVLVQVLITLVVVALTMPVLMARVPAVRLPGVGPGVMVIAAAVVFVLLRIVWPSRRGESTRR